MHSVPGWAVVFVVIVVTTTTHCNAARVTIRNDVPRVDVKGDIIDAHSGMILQHNNTYYWYGERYGDTTGTVTTWGQQGAPRVGVYTSNDLVTWEDRGEILPNDTPACKAKPASCTQWVPWVLYDERRSTWVAWFGSGDWRVATSDDGIHFTYKGGPQTSRFGGRTDGNVIFIDDDGKGYIIFSVTDLGHKVTIERLTDDYTATTHVGVGDFFPDTFVETPILFKRSGIYYVTYGTCCCACREGSGLVVFTSRSINGPWVRQSPHGDVNCDGGAPSEICKGDSRSTGNFTIPTQGYSLNPLGTAAAGGPELVWMGNLWLHGPHNNKQCTSLCANTAACTIGESAYRVGLDPTYWTPLTFDSQGVIAPLHWRDSFDLDLP